MWNLSSIGRALHWGGAAALIAIVALLVSVVDDQSQTQVDFDGRLSAVQALQARHGERVVELPEDGERWHTVVVYQSQELRSPADRRLAGMLASTPRLQYLQAQTTVNVWDAANPLYRTRFARTIGEALPAVMLQTHQGQVCYKASGENLPTTGEQLADEIQAAIEQCRPRPPAEEPEPDTAQLRPRRPGGLIPDLRPGRGLQEQAGQFALLGGLAILAAAGAGVYLGRRNRG